MPSIVTNDATETALRKLLVGRAYTVSGKRSYGETGSDVVAKKGSAKICVEVIGYKSSGPARAKDFFEVFLRAVSRIKDGAGKCVIALPSRAKVGLPARAKQYGVARRRLGEAFPELELWLVDVEEGTLEETHWNDWLSKD
jgi:hypothetical protein